MSLDALRRGIVNSIIWSHSLQEKVNNLLLDWMYLFTLLPTHYFKLLLWKCDNNQLWQLRKALDNHLFFAFNDFWNPWLTAKLLQTFDRLHLRERCVSGWSYMHPLLRNVWPYIPYGFHRHIHIIISISHKQCVWCHCYIHMVLHTSHICNYH